MRSILSPRLLAAAGVAAAFAGSTLVARPSPFEGQRTPTLQEAVRRTIAAGSARMSGTVSGADGTALTFRGVTSFDDAGTELEARRAGAVDDSPIELRTTATGTWLRTPALGRWIAVPHDGAGGSAGGLPAGWGSVLRRLSRSTAAAERVAFEVDDRGRIRWLRFSHAGAGVDVSFRNFGSPVAVEPPATTP